MVSLQALCNTILEKSFQEYRLINLIKLQSLLFLINREYTAKFNTPLFSEKFLTWKHGFVLSSVHDKFRSFQTNPITRFARDAQNKVFLLDEQYNPDMFQVINDIWRRYRDKPETELLQICNMGTH